MNPVTSAKLKMLEGSQRCLAFGLISLVTLMGVPFAIMATASRGEEHGFSGFCFLISVLAMSGFPFAVLASGLSVKVRVQEKRFWNAARPYRIIGEICAMLAVIASFIVVALIIFLIGSGDLFRR